MKGYRNFRTCVRVALVLMLSAPVMAQEPPTETAQQFDVQLRELQTQRSEFEKLVEDELNPRRNEIRNMFSETLKQLDDHLVALRSKPDDKARKSRYEETLSKAIAQSADILTEYQELESKTLQRLDGFSTAIRNAKEECTKQKEVSIQEVAQYNQRTTEIESKLRQIAEKYRTLLEKNEVLPEDVALDVRLLETDLGIARQTGAFASIAEQDMLATAEDLAVQLGELNELKASLRVSFRRASGQRMLLAKVGEIKARRLSAQQMRERIAVMSRVIPGLKSDLDSVDGLINRFMKHDVPTKGKSGTAASVASEPRPETAILKSYLSPSVPLKETTNATTVAPELN